jgi:diacylglycerol kinase
MKPFFKSFLYAFQGIRASLEEQRNLKVQSFVGVITIGAGFYFNISPDEWCIVLLAIGMVIGLEMMNTAIEDLVDLVTTEWKPLAGKVKDMAAGAVLFVSVIAVIIGVLIFRKYLIS